MIEKQTTKKPRKRAGRSSHAPHTKGLCVDESAKYYNYELAAQYQGTHQSRLECTPTHNRQTSQKEEEKHTQLQQDTQKPKRLFFCTSSPLHLKVSEQPV